MLNRLRTLVESRGNHTAGLAPSASAARTLERESGIESETVQKFLARHEGIVEGRGTATGLRNMRDRFSKTVLVVDESSLASSEQMRGLLRIATTLRIPRVVLVGDEKQLGAVEAGKPFEQVRQAGMQTVVMDEILRQRDMELREAVRAVLAGEVRTAFEKLGDRVAQVEREDIGGEAAEPGAFHVVCPPTAVTRHRTRCKHEVGSFTHPSYRAVSDAPQHADDPRRSGT